MQPQSSSNSWILSGCIVFIFCAVTGILLRFIPPRRESDYMLIGTIATMICLVVIFFAINQTSLKARDVFYKVRRRSS